MNSSKIKKIIESAGIEDAVFNCDTSRLCSIAAGGRAAALVTSESAGEIAGLMAALSEAGIGFLMFGGGTNILITRDIPDLVLIKPGKSMGRISINNGTIEAGAAAAVPALVKKAAGAGLDLSFLAGIPGTAGGAVSGNSGSLKEWICSYIESMEYIGHGTNGYGLTRCGGSDIKAGYRSLDMPDVAAVISVVLKPERMERSELASKIKDNFDMRKKTQPVGARTSGCFFKNPRTGDKTAGALIDECGLKGLSCGGARVSNVHANFIENFKSASPEDIVVLSRMIIDKVRDKYGISLEYEVKLIGNGHG